MLPELEVDPVVLPVDDCPVVLPDELRLVLGLTDALYDLCAAALAAALATNSMAEREGGGGRCGCWLRRSLSRGSGLERLSRCPPLRRGEGDR